jgi:dTDP-4-amino-4,6-dideoxygalactose transaminase
MAKMPKHKSNPAFKVVDAFEAAVAKYTGAPSVVAVNSCTMALRLCLEWAAHQEKAPGVITIPRRTYLSVPMQILHTGFDVKFSRDEWSGMYQLHPLTVWDSARLFTGGMFPRAKAFGSTFICVSFHASKTLGIEQGGAILHNAGKEADHWLRAMRHDGRIAGQPITKDTVKLLGLHCYMSPSVAAQGLLKISSLPEHNEPLPNSGYPDLSKFEVFKC